MSQRRIHLIAPAGSCRVFLKTLGVGSAEELVGRVQEIVGGRFRVTGTAKLIDAEEDDHCGGRTDDELRAQDIEEALADSQVAAIIGLRGGAWFTRVLPQIDFSVLDRRSSRVAVFGFSELTPLINLVASHRLGVGVYYMGPAFLSYGMRRFAERTRSSDAALRLVGDESAAQAWMEERLPREFEAYFRGVVAMIEGGSGEFSVTARRVRGEIPDQFGAIFVGGNLTVLSTMIGSRYEQCIEPTGRWLLLEDFNDKPERFDRFFSHLTLAGFWDRCDGVLLGDFHQGDTDLLDSVMAMLAFHLPRDRSVPVLYASEVGHIWPMIPIPLHAPATLRRVDGDSVTLSWAACVFAVV